MIKTLITYFIFGFLLTYNGYGLGYVGHNGKTIKITDYKFFDTLPEAIKFMNEEEIKIYQNVKLYKAEEVQIVIREVEETVKIKKDRWELK